MLKEKKEVVMYVADWCHSCESIKPKAKNIIENNSYSMKVINLSNCTTTITDNLPIKSLPAFYVNDKVIHNIRDLENELKGSC